MTSFVHLEYPTRHPGVARIENAVATAKRFRQGFDSTRSLTTMLLAAVVAALVVAADQLVDTWADGHLLAAWVVLWTVGFAAIALFAGTAKQLAKGLISSLDAWSQRVARARADARLLELAQKDPRVMADLRSAMTRNER